MSESAAAKAKASDRRADMADLLGRTQQFLAARVEDLVVGPVRGAGRSASRWFIRVALAVVCLCVATVCLLYGSMRLLDLWLPQPGAYFVVGGFALVLGLFFSRG